MVWDLVAEVSEMLWGLCWVDNEEDRVAVDLKQVVDNVTLMMCRATS